MSIGRAYLEMGRYEEARESLLKALDNNWKDADTYSIWAWPISI
ncbi:MAG TPA: hypothetical protein VN642_02390 [Dongiaceae bacterium]|nr:hypothetical protein [Dongiaceae bacterium]